MSPGHGPLAAVKARREPAVAQFREELASIGALHGEHRVARLAVVDVDVELAGVGLEPLEILVVVGRVRHAEEVVVGQAVGEEVIQHAAVYAGVPAANHAFKVAAPILQELRDAVS